MPSLDVVDDTIRPHGGSYDDMTPRDIHVRNAMFWITILGPIFGSLLVGFFSNKGWSYASTWSFQRLTIFWFLSVGVFGALVYLQRGVTDRTTFIFAVLHTQFEVLITALLLKYTLRAGLFLTAVWGSILYFATLALPDITAVYFSAAILGGGGDVLIFLLLAYGKKWLYAAGAFFHLASAVIVFAGTLIFIDVTLINVLIFLSLWLYLGFTTAAIIQNAAIKEETRYIELPISTSSATDVTLEQDWGNPLHDVTVSTPILALLVGVSLVGSTILSVTLYRFAS